MNKILLFWFIFLVTSVSAFSAVYEVGSVDDLVGSEVHSACTSSDIITLTDDIDMAGKDFSPMCPDGFTGVFDGNGHTISNLTISANMKQEKNIAFIAVLKEDGVLRNLTFNNPGIEAWQHGNGKIDNVSVAVAVGDLQGGVVENVHVISGTVTVQEGKNAAGISAGGLAGTAESGNISESGGAIDVSHDGSGSVVVGGICGNVTGDVILASVFYSGDAPVAGSVVDGVTLTSKYGAVTISQTSSTKSAVIDGEYTGSATVEMASDVKVNSVTLDRTFNVGAISTLYLPFSIDVGDVDGASVYKFKTIEKSEADDRWKFKVSTAENIVANTPYIILPSATQVAFNIAESVNINTSIPSTEKVSEGKWVFRGTYEYMTFAETSEEAYYVFAGKNIGGTKLGEFVKSSGYANPMRAYLIYHKNAVATKSINGNLGGSITLPNEIDIEVENEKGIVVETGTLNTVTGAIRMDCWFDLKGRRLNSKPTVKGTYYKNGKKAIIK